MLDVLAGMTLGAGVLQAMPAPRAASLAPGLPLVNVVPPEAPAPVVVGRPPPAPSRPHRASACPADMVLVAGELCPLLRYACREHSDDAEYRCAEYARGQPCQGKPEPRRYCIDRYEFPNRVGAMPRVYVDWNEAKQACAALGKRLCRRSEWVLACEGPKRLPYPWGFVRQPSPCNVDRPSIPFDARALEREESREEELARLWQADPIGSHPDCVSAYGVYDLAGNVDEWTDNQLDNPATKRPSTLNGGYWGPVRDTCRLTTGSHGPRFRFYQVGFRCCADPRDGVATAPPRPWIEGEPEPEEPDGG